MSGRKRWDTASDVELWVLYHYGYASTSIARTMMRSDASIRGRLGILKRRRSLFSEVTLTEEKRGNV